MPIYDFVCQSDCIDEGVVVERYIRSFSAQNPSCEKCGNGMRRLTVNRFGVVFTGPLTAKYNDNKLEMAHEDGHFAYAKNTPDGKPRLEFIDSFDKQRDFCKREGLVNPKESPAAAEISTDGRKLSSQGMPGCWV